MIKLFIDKKDNIYIVDEDKNKVVKIGIGNNEEYYLEFFEYENVGKIDVEIPIDNNLYNVFLKFYVTLIECYLEKDKQGIDKFHHQNYNVPKLYNQGIITIYSDDVNDKTPNTLKIYLLEDKLVLEYSKNATYSDSIRIRTNESIYHDMLKPFHELFQDLKHLNKIEIENGNEAFQMTKIYKDINKSND